MALGVFIAWLWEKFSSLAIAAMNRFSLARFESSFKATSAAVLSVTIESFLSLQVSTPLARAS
ncbi:hypothetical protein P4O66_016461 [Electrophorus voltai]|uniref:Uncharacterized protein n=1 Tax=Electrophorus voltai TaxID=2609070 RepID=A0AAD9DP50_9TELE|nr:hypothetical protein P4O66_016461 [Electrophorus voltai]